MKISKDMIQAEILDAVRGEALRTLARNSMTCVVTDMLGEMAITAARTVNPKLDELFTYDPPDELMTDVPIPADAGYYQPRLSVRFQNLANDLWTPETNSNIQDKIRNLLSCNKVIRNTLRGEILRNRQSTTYTLYISALAKKG